MTTTATTSTTTSAAASGPRPADRSGPVLAGSAGPLLDAHDTLLLDLDGVVYVGPDAVPHAPAALAAAREAGVRLAYITNNAARTPDVVAAHLRELGAPADDDDVVTSAQAAARHLAATLAPGSPVLLVGGRGLRVALTEVGLRPVDSLAQEPAAVVQGFSPDIGWKLLAEATHAVRSGLPWTASNLDRTVPTPGGPAPGNGLLVELVAAAAGRRPGTVCGKPERALFDEAVRRTGARSALVVGDRLDTDLQGARTAGLPGLLVLTGVTGVAELVAAAPHERPTAVAHDLRGLRAEHPGPEVGGDASAVTARCRDARVEVADGVLRVVSSAPGPDGLDVLRAGAEACWWTADTGAPLDPDAAAAVLREHVAVGTGS
ncbi:HAD-IIA family hydrolase [Kineococcus terrestris]|uniref:HAD-IIA family hydrolase n=1 Tax=Kineococcus terrestris TaxID=2044856 RepID=UPI0034DAEFD2